LCSELASCIGVIGFDFQNFEDDGELSRREELEWDTESESDFETELEVVEETIICNSENVPDATAALFIRLVKQCRRSTYYHSFDCNIKIMKRSSARTTHNLMIFIPRFINEKQQRAF
jgi:hypothetical protein